MSKEDLDKWLKDSVARNAPKMEDATVFASIVSKNYMEDPSCALQIGLAVLMDKPIILLVDKNMKIPGHLTKIAEVIERVDLDNKADVARASESIKNFAQRIHDTEEKYAGSKT